MSPYRYPEPTPESDPFPEGERVKHELDDEVDEKQRLAYLRFQLYIARALQRVERRRRIQRFFDSALGTLAIFLITFVWFASGMLLGKCLR